MSEKKTLCGLKIYGLGEGVAGDWTTILSATSVAVAAPGVPDVAICRPVGGIGVPCGGIP